jgi:hypothetical protein
LRVVTRNFALPTGAPESDAGPGVEGNSRLTASTGIVLSVLLIIEGVTILDVRGYITLHTVIGLALIGPLVLKTATTCYRFARYYTRHRDYVRRGAPPLLLRAIGPFVILSSVAVIGTGVALLATHGASDTWLTLHQASFIVWIAFTGLHFLGHIYEAVVVTARDIRRGRDDFAARGRVVRLGLVATSLVVGFGVAAVFTPSASSWQLHQHFEHGDFRGR